jgi:hypothetical protein
MTLKFSIGEIVYLRTDVEQLPRMVISAEVGIGWVIYSLASGVNTSRHYDFEIIRERDILIGNLN